VVAVEASVAKLSPEDRARILNQSLAHFRNPSGPDLLKRTERFNEADVALGRVLKQGPGPIRRYTVLLLLAWMMDSVETLRGSTRQVVMRSNGRLLIRLPSLVTTCVESIWRYLETRPRWESP